ncbi:RNase P modulator RnpM [Spiroplasma corruscae]|nr:YlxR family protein [Spiroplasma corruscae]
MKKKLNKQVLRKDVASNKMLPKDTLLRIVRNKRGEVFVDHTKVAEGRGVYVLPNNISIKKIKQRNILDRAFKTTINRDIYEAIEKELMRLVNYE